MNFEKLMFMKAQNPLGREESVLIHSEDKIVGGTKNESDKSQMFAILS